MEQRKSSLTTKNIFKTDPRIRRTLHEYKAHGSSDAYAFRNAIRQAIGCVDNKVTYEIAKLVVPELTSKEAETQA